MHIFFHHFSKEKQAQSTTPDLFPSISPSILISSICLQVSAPHAEDGTFSAECSDSLNVTSETRLTWGPQGPGQLGSHNRWQQWCRPLKWPCHRQRDRHCRRCCRIAESCWYEKFPYPDTSTVITASDRKGSPSDLPNGERFLFWLCRFSII